MGDDFGVFPKSYVQPYGEDPPVRCRVRVLFDFVSGDVTELSLSKGETVDVVDDKLPSQHGWWLAKKGDTYGEMRVFH